MALYLMLFVVLLQRSYFEPPVACELARAVFSARVSEGGEKEGCRLDSADVIDVEKKGGEMTIRKALIEEMMVMEKRTYDLARRCQLLNWYQAARGFRKARFGDVSGRPLQGGFVQRPLIG
jgi:hypothetical protein